ncbi:hypothetical protein OH492_12945 [Vibrio chagasii]|nr:hypothetical protein [Vibrio chagasii]
MRLQAKDKEMQKCNVRFDHHNDSGDHQRWLYGKLTPLEVALPSGRHHNYLC